MNASAPPTAADALQMLVQPARTGFGPQTAWPASHRLLATTAGILLCLLATTGCTQTRPTVADRAVVPSYSYVHDATPEVRQSLWPQAPLGHGTLLAGVETPH